MTGRELLRLVRTARREFRDRLGRAVDPVGHYRALGARIGCDCRLIDCDFGSEPYLVTLGDHVSATSTCFITHDGGVWVFRDEWPEADVFGAITIGNNVFLGTRTIVLPGVTIGDNVVVGAGSIVSQDLPSNCVAAGVPARPIRSLDDYRTTLNDRIIGTKGLDRANKREIVRRRFGNGDQS